MGLRRPYLTLMRENAPQRDYPLREHSMRETFNGLRWMARAGVVAQYGLNG